MKFLTVFTVFLITIISLLLFHSAGARTNGVQTNANDYLIQIVREDALEDITDYLVDFDQLNGLVFIDKEHQLQTDEQNLNNHFTVTEPMTVFPSPFPAELYEEAMDLQPLMALVHLRVSRNYKFLKEAMKEVALADPNFIGKMVDIMDKVQGNRRQSGLTLIQQRSDYLTHQEKLADGQTSISLKQIEVTSGTNAGQGDTPFLAHQRVLDKIIYTEEGEMNEGGIPEWFKALKVPKSEAVTKQAEALYKTWVEFHRVNKLEGKERNGVILLISAPKRRAHSHFEQLHWVQFKLEDIARNIQNGGRPHVIQITIKQCARRLSLGTDQHLYLGKRRVAVAVWLDGYLPEHFSGPDDHDKRDWKMRLEMEQSRAVISPNIFVYFASSKTVQQALSKEGKLEEFFPEIKENTRESEKLKDDLARLRATFIQMWALGKEGNEEVNLIKHAIANHGQFVLKKNLEGGKGNFFGEELVKELKDEFGELKNHKDRGMYILQKKIKPFVAMNAIVPVPSKDVPKPPAVHFVDVSSELSVFGSLLAVTTNPRDDSQTNAKSDGVESETHVGRKREHAKIAAHEFGEGASSSKIQRVEHGGGRHVIHGDLHEENDDRHDKMHGYSRIQGDQLVLLNTVDGYLIRSKISSNNMCTVSKGQGGLDSLVLFPLKLFVYKEPAVNAECSAAAAGEGVKIVEQQEDAVLSKMKRKRQDMSPKLLERKRHNG